MFSCILAYLYGKEPVRKSAIFTFKSRAKYTFLYIFVHMLCANIFILLDVYMMLCSSAVELIFSEDHISFKVALKRPIVTVKTV